MIRINLLSVREAQAEAGRRTESRLIVLGGVLVLALLLFVEVWSRMQLVPVRAEYEQLQSDLKLLEAKTTELTALEKNRKELDEKLKTIETLQQKKVGPAKVLADLSDSAPDQVWLLEFTEDQGAATITGFAFDNQTIASFMRKLSESHYFSDVDLQETTQAVKEGSQLKRFVVKARLSYTGTPLPPAPPNLKYPDAAKGNGPERKPRNGRGA
jgi:type IV pilus assembly protein PilN